MRNWHLLRRPRQAGWPAQSIALSVVSSAGRVVGDGQYERSGTLLGWSAVLWRGEDGRQEEWRQADGIDAGSWWRWLAAKLRKGTSTWIWQLHACYGMTQLGMWDALTRKEWVICGRDSRAGSGGEPDDSAGNGGLCVVSDPPTILLARPAGGGGGASWLDVRNLSPRAGWNDLATDVGMLGTLSESSCDWQTGREIARCRADIMARWLDGWYGVVRDLRLGGLRMTASSQAWAGWRTSYLSCPVEVHDDERRLRLETDSIFGGRNEAYRVGVRCDSVYEIDATAHYPSIAASCVLPGRVARRSGACAESARASVRDGFLVIARGCLSTDVPCVPYRRDGVTVYPTGRWRATYCWPEWELVERCGGRIAIDEWYAYEPCDPWSAYMRALWDARCRLKREGRSAHAIAVKLLMNSLVGKACAKNKAWVDLPDEGHYRPWDAWHHYGEGATESVRRRCIAWRVQEERDDGFGPEAVPALASWVYSLGRVRLWEWMNLAALEEIFYVDTDSLWTSGRGADRIRASGQIRAGELGGLHHVATHAWFRAHGHKWYETPTGVVCAGVPPQEVVSSGDKWTRWLSESPGQAARVGRAPTGQLTRIEIFGRQAYRGGRVGADGTVYPWEVYEDEQEEGRSR